MPIIDLDLPITADTRRLEALQGVIVLVKYGGNAMINERVKHGIISDIITLKRAGAIPVVVHGGGPVIRELLDKVGMESEFVEGHRKTDTETMGYVEMALSGNVNSEIVNLINASGLKAVGLSGKDGGMVTARKRTHTVTLDGKEDEIDLGHVGDVDRIDTGLIHTLIADDYIPVLSPIAAGDDLDDYNVNADMFAGHMAGALQAAHYVAMTDVDGLLRVTDEPSSLIDEITVAEAQEEIGNTIRGGMIPKVESAIIALKEGVGSAHIINGTQSHSLLRELLTSDRSGTLIQP